MWVELAEVDKEDIFLFSLFSFYGVCNIPWVYGLFKNLPPLKASGKNGRKEW